MAKIIIVDDEMLIRDGLKLMLSLFEDIEVIGTAINGKDGFALCEQHKSQIDVVLMDIRMPEYDGVIGTRLIKEAYPHIKVLILTTFNDQSYIHDALTYGASGYLLKDSSHEIIHESIKSTLTGNVIFHPDVASQLLSPMSSVKQTVNFYEQYRLSEKELNIIREIAEGLSNKEIATKLFLSEGTIKNHITNILFKLELRDRTQIAIFAFKNGLA